MVFVVLMADLKKDINHHKVVLDFIKTCDTEKCNYQQSHNRNLPNYC